jgi:GrpB-like predicted nucleotidyltransferase (UPF0157 family)
MDEIRTIKVVPYDPCWPAMFEAAAQEMRAILGQEVSAVHHIGSTSIPGLAAKPIIDLLVEVRLITRVDAFEERMRARGYLAYGEHGIPGRRFFLKGTPVHRTHHVHTYMQGHPKVKEHLDFRDYMIAHPEAARAYGALKERLATEFPHDIEAYMAGKNCMIKELIFKAWAWKESAA